MKRLAFSVLAALSLTIATAPGMASAAQAVQSGRYIGNTGCGPACRSLNWSGYSVTRHHYTSVTGSWVVPAVDCSSGGRQFSSTWIGLNGWNNGTVEQTGTDGKCVQGTAYYRAWWEVFPDYPEIIKFHVAPGDQIAASVVYDPAAGSYTMKLVDSTKGRSLKYVYTNPAYAPNTSAEWIVERPALCTDPQCNGFKITRLAKYGTVTFTNATANGQPISRWTSHAVTMVDSKLRDMSVPGPLGGSGDTFTATWESFGTISKFS